MVFIYDNVYALYICDVYAVDLCYAACQFCACVCANKIMCVCYHVRWRLPTKNSISLILTKSSSARGKRSWKPTSRRSSRFDMLRVLYIVYDIHIYYILFVYICKNVCVVYVYHYTYLHRCMYSVYLPSIYVAYERDRECVCVYECNCVYVACV